MDNYDTEIEDQSSPEEKPDIRDFSKKPNRSPIPSHSANPSPECQGCNIPIPSGDTPTKQYCGFSTEEALVQFFINSGMRVSDENRNVVERETFPNQNVEEANQEVRQAWW